MATTETASGADSPVAVRLFGGGAPATGETAQLTFWSSQIEVRSARGTQRVPVESLRVREVISAEAGLELSWEARGGTCAAQVHDPAAIRRLRSHPLLQATPQMARLRSGQRRRRTVRTLVLALLALLVLLPLLLVLLFFWQADRIAATIAGRIPVATEDHLGRQLFARMRDTLALQEHGGSVLLVRELGARLAGGSPFHFEFHVAQDAAINAFALPGGIVVVNSGLIEAVRRPEELAGVLAHEVQHVKLRHGLKDMVKALGLRGLWSAITGDVGGALATDATLRLATLHFSRAAELQADAAAFESLVALDIDPSGLLDILGTMEEAAGPAPPAWLSTHPAGTARRQALQQQLQALEGRRFPALSAAGPATAP